MPDTSSCNTPGKSILSQSFCHWTSTWFNQLSARAYHGHFLLGGPDLGPLPPSVVWCLPPTQGQQWQWKRASSRLPLTSPQITAVLWLVRPGQRPWDPHGERLVGRPAIDDHLSELCPEPDHGIHKGIFFSYCSENPDNSVCLPVT